MRDPVSIIPPHVNLLLEALYEYDRAASKFIDKCENGGAFSRTTRRELTEALEHSRSASARALAALVNEAPKP